MKTIVYELATGSNLSATRSRIFYSEDAAYENMVIYAKQYTDAGYGDVKIVENEAIAENNKTVATVLEKQIE